MAYDYEWDPNVPTGAEPRSNGDNRIREMKGALDERLVRIFPQWPNNAAVDETAPMELAENYVQEKNLQTTMRQVLAVMVRVDVVLDPQGFQASGDAAVADAVGALETDFVQVQVPAGVYGYTFHALPTGDGSVSVILDHLDAGASAWNGDLTLVLFRTLLEHP